MARRRPPRDPLMELELRLLRDRREALEAVKKVADRADEVHKKLSDQEEKGDREF